MFKKRHIRISLSKDTNSPIEESTPFEIPEEAISRVTQDVVKKISIGVIAVMGATAVFATTGTVIVNTFDNHQTKDHT